MHRDHPWIAFCLFLTCASAVAQACGAGLPTPDQQVSVAQDAYDQQQCVDTVDASLGRDAAKQAIDQCRMLVQMRRPMGSPGGPGAVK